MRIQISIIFACTVWTMLACEYSEGEFFYVKNNGAEMPVWVKGNDDSNTIIVTLNGGPGDSSFWFSLSDSFGSLEEKYKIAYWEQRASGYARGNPDEKSLTMENFVDDLDLVVDVLRHKYGNPTIFLLGHSWGGGLGTAYLLDPIRQGKITGWIEVDGAHNWVETLSAQRALNMAHANEKIAAPSTSKKSTSYWEGALRYYQEHTTLTYADKDKHIAYGISMITDVRPQELESPYGDNIEDLGETILFSPVDVEAVGFNVSEMSKNRPMRELLFSLNYSSQMADITLPALVLWGRYDFTIPVELAEDAYHSLGTPEDSKSIVILEDSGHSPMFTEPAKFFESVDAFVMQYE